MNQFLRFLFGVGFLMTEPRERRRVYDRATDQLDDVADQASRGYRAVADRVEHLYRAARGEDERALSGAACFLIGAGIGAGAALLFAPASGQETREAIAEKVREFQNNAHGVARKTA